MLFPACSLSKIQHIIRVLASRFLANYTWSDPALSYIIFVKFGRGCSRSLNKFQRIPQWTLSKIYLVLCHCISWLNIDVLKKVLLFLLLVPSYSAPVMTWIPLQFYHLIVFLNPSIRIRFINCLLSNSSCKLLFQYSIRSLRQISLSSSLLFFLSFIFSQIDNPLYGSLRVFTGFPPFRDPSDWVRHKEYKSNIMSIVYFIIEA